MQGQNTIYDYHDGESEANAAYIVLAVNCHDELVEALRRCESAWRAEASYYPHQRQVENRLEMAEMCRIALLYVIEPSPTPKAGKRRSAR